jgi:hypothetical protein
MNIEFHSSFFMLYRDNTDTDEETQDQRQRQGLNPGLWDEIHLIAPGV